MPRVPLLKHRLRLLLLPHASDINRPAAAQVVHVGVRARFEQEMEDGAMSMACSIMRRSPPFIVLHIDARARAQKQPYGRWMALASRKVERSEMEGISSAHVGAACDEPL